MLSSCYLVKVTVIVATRANDIVSDWVEEHSVDYVQSLVYTSARKKKIEIKQNE